MKKVLLVMVLLFVSGCGMPTQQDYQNWTATLDAVIPAVKEVAGDNPKLDKIIGDVELVRESVANAKTLPEAVGSIIEVSETMGNPYAKPMAAGLGLVTTLLALWGNQKRKEAVTANTDKAVVANKYSAMKKGVNEFIAANENGGTLYENIGNARKAKGIA